jgi:hypothetical protein
LWLAFANIPCLDNIQECARSFQSPPLMLSKVIYCALIWGLYSGGATHRSEMPLKTLKGNFKEQSSVRLFMYFIQHCFICRPSDSTVSTDAGIELKTVATFALAAY